MEAPRAIAVFCGSRMGNDPVHAATAADLGRALAARGVHLVYGGGRIGLMGVVADAVIAGGGQVTGVIPEFLAKLEVEHAGITELVEVTSMHERKNIMFERADAFVVLPGGLGTLDEAMEIITWKQLHVHAKPVVVLDPVGYWRPFVDLIQATVDGGFAREKVMELFTVVAAVDDVFAAIALAPQPDQNVITSHL